MATILVVDDHSVNREFLKTLLGYYDHQVLEAGDGAEALAIARQSPPDLIISDLLMPVMDGYTLLRHWKVDDRLRHAPFIVYTATYSDNADEQLARSLGADAFIIKPAEPDYIMTQIREVQAKAASNLPNNSVGNEKVLLKEYNEALIRKLEHKTQKLEEANRKLLQDIAERQRISDKLFESERRFNNMLSNIQMVAIMLDTNARITYCNDHLLRLTGWRREEVIGQDWFDLFIPPENRGLKDVFRALINNQPEVSHYENEILMRSGERRLIHWNNSVLRSEIGDVIGTASIGEDITQRKIAEEVLKKRKEELEQFHRLSVGRELQMIELKKQANALAIQAGQKPPYDLAFLDMQAVKPGHEKT